MHVPVCTDTSIFTLVSRREVHVSSSDSGQRKALSKELGRIYRNLPAYPFYNPKITHFPQQTLSCLDLQSISFSQGHAFIYIYFGLGRGSSRVYLFWQFWWFQSSNGLHLINLCQKITNIGGFSIKKAKLVASFVQKHKIQALREEINLAESVMSTKLGLATSAIPVWSLKVVRKSFWQ